MKIFQIKFEIFLLDLFKTQKALTFELCFLYQFPETVWQSLEIARSMMKRILAINQ